ncbi:plastocyanin/azurin family copper-binding protein [Pyrinomonas sp.]|uniref:cupredoxin domain-containing protein n=1 Tax=Pyrinomonas sp. TaxID=2080306 RepID=UPI0033202649
MKVKSLLASMLLAANIAVATAPAQKAQHKKRRAAVANVAMTNFEFKPKELRVKAGTTVVWTDEEGTHQVTSDDGRSFSSPTLNPGQVFRHRFTKAGRYPYYCSFHGGKGGSGMSGIIIVEK